MLWQHSYADRIYTEWSTAVSTILDYCKKYHPECTKMRHFPLRSPNIFLGRGHSPLHRPLPQWGGGYPLPTPYPSRRRRRLVRRAFGARPTPQTTNPGCAPVGGGKSAGPIKIRLLQPGVQIIKYSRISGFVVDLILWLRGDLCTIIIHEKKLR